MSGWHVLSSRSDVDDLLTQFDYFHDACVRELHLWTETFVDTELRMSCPGHLDTHIRILFQKQSVAPSAIEMQFDEVVQFNFQPSLENYDSIIFSAGIFIEDGIYYWVEGGGKDLKTALAGKITWIAGKKLKWRDSSSLMGDKLRYCSGPP
jgi:hypothetical protein